MLWDLAAPCWKTFKEICVCVFFLYFLDWFSFSISACACAQEECVCFGFCLHMQQQYVPLIIWFVSFVNRTIKINFLATVHTQVNTANCLECATWCNLAHGWETFQWVALVSHTHTHNCGAGSIAELLIRMESKASHGKSSTAPICDTTCNCLIGCYVGDRMW